MSDMANHPGAGRKAVLHRMVMPHHTCPYGLKAKDLLKRSGYEVEDRHLTTRAETDAFKANHAVATTPQVFIGGERVGGYDDLRRFLGKRVPDPQATTYRPVIALFTMTALLAMAASYAVTGDIISLRAGEWFIGMSMVVLALLKLQNVETFATMFLNYDLLAKRWVPYGYIYPFAEGLERHGQITGIMKAQIDHLPLQMRGVRPTQGRTLAVMQVSGGSQSFNAVNSLRLLGRWMRMFTIPNQSSVAMAYNEFDADGRMRASSYYDRIVDVMEELVRFTVLMRPHAAQLVDRYSERKEAGVPVDLANDHSAIAIAR